MESESALVAYNPSCFQVTNDPAEINIYLLDGSLIDEEEYFSTLKPQTTLILQKPGEKVLSGRWFTFESFFFFF